MRDQTPFRIAQAPWWHRPFARVLAAPCRCIRCTAERRARGRREHGGLFELSRRQRSWPCCGRPPRLRDLHRCICKADADVEYEAENELLTQHTTDHAALGP